MKIILLLPFFFLIAIGHQCQPPADQQRSINTGSKKIHWLRNIRTTTRISSNHYSDLVMDKSGNSYIACFYTSNGVDHIYLVKVSPGGEIVWEVNNPNEGRATAIAIDSDENIWVTGYFTGTLDLGEQTAFTSDQAMFVARFNAAGQCRQLLSSIGTGIGYNIHANGQGEIMISGIYDDSLSLGGTEIINATKHSEGQFIAITDLQGNCHFIENFAGYISRIKSDRKGNFYLCGRFYGTLKYAGNTLVSESNFDNDAFLMKTDAEGGLQWIRQYGKKGNIRKGYRSGEGFHDFIFLANGKLFVTATSELPYNGMQMPLLPGEGSLKLVIVEFSSDGNITSEKVLATDVNGGSPQTIAGTSKGNIYLTFSAIRETVISGTVIDFADDYKSVLLQYNSKWKLTDRLLPGDGTDALFRTVYAWEDRVNIAGHYRNRLSIDGKTIENDGRHALYLLSVKD